jgi:hypothetical protein
MHPQECSGFGPEGISQKAARTPFDGRFAMRRDATHKKEPHDLLQVSSNIKRRDGAGQHPTQCLDLLLSLREEENQRE